MAKRPDFASSIYFGKDGYWHGRVTVGIRDNGKPDRRHVMGKDEKSVIKKVRDLERNRDSGNVSKPGKKKLTFEEWLTYWLDNIAAPSVKQSTYSAYRVAVQVHLVPGLGAHKLARLKPEHLEKFYAQMIGAGSKPGNAHLVHRTARTALGEAHRRGEISSNPAALAKPPRLTEDEVEPYTVAEVRRLLEEASKNRNSARWAIALALGLRQGEVLGLKWVDVDLENATMRIRRNRTRPKYRHGCGEGETCGRKAGYCPQRIKVNADTDDTKSQAGRRTVGLPPELVELLRTHRTEQDVERKAARQLWKDGGWLFATTTGGPLSPNTDYHDWKALLQRAGVRDGRLHDARHTAATVLLILGVAERAVMALMGWSSSGMTKRYQHVTAQILKDVAGQVGTLIWAPKKPDKAPKKPRKKSGKKKPKKGDQAPPTDGG